MAQDKILVTGTAGFIAFHVARRLLEDGERVVGVDNLNDYYDPSLKRNRLAEIEDEGGFTFRKLDLADGDATGSLFAEHDFDVVIHMAAQAGVRYSLEHPEEYVDSNLVGFVNVLEGCRHGEVENLIFASSSSVYGANRKVPFETTDPTDHPVSLYGATKKSNELLAHSYADLYDLPCTGLRFFTVYGPWGRPDMAYFLFTDRILEGEAIDVFGQGEMRRDFTYVDDVVEGVVRLCDVPATREESWDPQDPEIGRSSAPFRIYNIGNGAPVDLMEFIEILEEKLGREAEKNYEPMQPGDVRETWANVDGLRETVGYEPSTSLEEGLEHFVRWYGAYYDVDAVGGEERR